MKKLWGNLIVVTAGIILVLLVELMLVLARVTPLVDKDPFVGFEGSTPIFVSDDTQPGRYILGTTMVSKQMKRFACLDHNTMF